MRLAGPPASVNVSVPELFGRQWAPVLGRRHAMRVFVGAAGRPFGAAAHVPRRPGAPPSAPLTAAEIDAQRFRAEAWAGLPRLIAEAKGLSTRPKPVVGGEGRMQLDPPATLRPAAAAAAPLPPARWAARKRSSVAARRA